MEIFAAIKMLSIICFSIFILLSIIRGNNRFVYFLIVLIAVSVNFWVRAKLGENPNISLYIVGILVYILTIVIVMWRNINKESKLESWTRSENEG